MRYFTIQRLSYFTEIILLISTININARSTSEDPNNTSTTLVAAILTINGANTQSEVVTISTDSSTTIHTTTPEPTTTHTTTSESTTIHTTTSNSTTNQTTTSEPTTIHTTTPEPTTIHTTTSSTTATPSSTTTSSSTTTTTTPLTSSLSTTTITTTSSTPSSTSTTIITTTSSTPSSTSTTITTISSTPSSTTTITSTSSTTTTTTTTSTTPSTTPAQICPYTLEEGIKVIDRESTYFTGSIQYNCTSDVPRLTVFGQSSANCTVTNASMADTHSTYNVTCNNIKRMAGRNYTFNVSGSSHSRNITNQLFTVTLVPLTISNWNITPDDSREIHQTTTNFTIVDCDEITYPEYIVLRCDRTSEINATKNGNCTFICPIQIPGSILNASIVRLPLPLADNGTDWHEETRDITYKISLDTVKHLTMNSSLENKTASISFIRPNGYYDEITIECIAQDMNCSSDSRSAIRSTTDHNCTSIELYPIIVGVNYTCIGITSKADFLNQTSDPNYTFKSNLLPVVYKGADTFDETNIDLDFKPLSDYQTIELDCSVPNDQSPCQNYNNTISNCLTKIGFTGYRGCNFSCTFTTEKSGYANSNPSNTYIISINPPQLFIKGFNVSESSIGMSWGIGELSYIQYFQIFANGGLMETLSSKTNFSLSGTDFSYILKKNIHPYRNYNLTLQLIANKNVMSSNWSIVETPQAPPNPPSEADAEAKIIIENSTDSTRPKFKISQSLFDDSNGPITKYQIYVRRDANNADPRIINNGTYGEAEQNKSIDYMALDINSTFIKRIIDDESDREIEIGTQENCASIIPCNGPLTPNDGYRILVAGCTIAGCSLAVSKPFETKGTDPDNKKLFYPYIIAGVASFVAVIIAIIIFVAIKSRKSGKYKKSSKRRPIRPTTMPPSAYNIEQKRPKPLYRYVNLTNDDIQEIESEYQELEGTSPQFSQSDYEPDYAPYNRYANIPARGPWNDTAVRLQGDHRLHDYINANEIMGLYSDRQYIASQGPLKETAEDFWEMVIQYEVLKIVMLTRTEEKNPHNPSQPLPKCTRYFPDNRDETLTFNSITIQVLEVEIRTSSNLEIRHLLIKNGREERRIYHYYFIGWPDFSVVDRASLLDLIETVDNHGLRSAESSRTDLLKPMVVHCSAGVGRTGTYIAVDIIRHLIDREQDDIRDMQLDVMGIVYQLRQDRAKMVQTKDQYILVNRCVEEYLKRINLYDDIVRQKMRSRNNNSTTVPVDDFVDFNQRNNGAGSETSCIYTKMPKYTEPTDD